MTELLKFRRPEHLQALSDSERAAFIQRCGEHDHDHRAAGIYRRVSSTVREAARGGIRARLHTPSRGIFELRLRIRLLAVVRFPCAFRHLHIRKSSREAGIFRAACIYAKPNFSGSFEHVANPHLRKLHPVSRTFYAVVIFAPAEPIPHGFYICRNRGRRPV